MRYQISSDAASAAFAPRPDEGDRVKVLIGKVTILAKSRPECEKSPKLPGGLSNALSTVAQKGWAKKL